MISRSGLRRLALFGHSSGFSSLPTARGLVATRAYSTDPAQTDSPNMKLEVEMKIEPLPRPNESDDKKRARLLYQSRKRGILETDLLLSRFAEKYLSSMSRAEMDEYDKLLDEPDWDIFYWATKNSEVKPCPEHWEKSEIMSKLRDLAENKERVVMRMPNL